MNIGPTLYVPLGTAILAAARARKRKRALRAALGAALGFVVLSVVGASKLPSFRVGA